jgi:GNAT superfamily N-acetyltransferase
MKLRDSSPSDWNLLCEIHDAVRKDELRSSGLLEAFLTLEQIAQSEGLFDGEVIVAEAESYVLGFVAYTESELDWLYVHPRAYRRGAGRLLLQHALVAGGGQM